MRILVCCLLVSIVGLGASLSATAAERSRIFIPLENRGVGDEIGKLWIDLSPDRAELRYRVRNLVANSEQRVMIGWYEAARYFADDRGRASGTLSLLPGFARAFTHDPRGVTVVVADNLAARVSLSPFLDEPRTEILEKTSLDRVEATSGFVDVRYEKLRNGVQRLGIALQDVDPGEYRIFLEDQEIAVLTVGSRRRGLAEFRQAAEGGGSSVDQAPSPSVFRATAFRNPHLHPILVEKDGVAQFEGRVLARIPGLSLCEPSSTTAPLVLAPGQTGAEASVTLDVDARCDLSFTVSASGLAPGIHDLYLGGSGWDAFTVLSDGLLNAHYVEDPRGELGGQEAYFHDVVQPGTTVEIREWWPLGIDTEFSGVLP